MLWRSTDLAAALAGRPIGNLPEGISGISIDSRSITPGDVFFAIKGDRFDGHDFASLAVANGASLIVVSEAKLPALGRLVVPMIVVDDVLKSLERLAIASRARSRAEIIAVTGSVGKTTTKEMLRHALEPFGKVHAAVASFNNHWGVPLTLSRMPADADFGVFEIGMNHPDEIRPLVKLVRPHVAIITTVAAAHLGNFDSIEQIAAAKAEIFEGVEPHGHVILNIDNDQYAFLVQAAQAAGIENIHSFGQQAKAEYRLAEYDGTGEGSVLWASIGGETHEVVIGAPGRHLAENAMAVLGTAKLLGLEMPEAVRSFASLSAVKGRGQRHKLKIGQGSFTLIDESYNANPASMRAALSVLAAAKPGKGGRRIAVLGDMLEMGEFAEAVHRDLSGPIMASGVDAVWLAGEAMAHLRDALPDTIAVEYRATTAELVDLALSNVRAGDVLMVKSSLGLQFGKIVTALLDNHPAFSDTERRH